MKFEVTGFDKLEKALAQRQYRVENGVKPRIRKVVAIMEEDLKRQTELSYIKGYSNPRTGTKASIRPEFSDDGLSGEIGPHMEYNGWTEFGTRFMDAMPIVEPHRSRNLKLFTDLMEELNE